MLAELTRLLTARGAQVVLGDSPGSLFNEPTLKRIYEPFFTTKPVGAGTGMGLAMVYGIIAHHHGWVQVKSSPGSGTEFLVFLPVNEERKEEV